MDNADIYVQSRLLLERLANSLYDRKNPDTREMYFTIKEAHIVEEWLADILKTEQS